MLLNNIYIYRSGGMGDVLWLEPVLRELSIRHKRVYFYTNFHELFHNYPEKNVFIKKIPTGSFRAVLKFLNLISKKKKYHRLDGYCYEAFPKMHILNAYQRYFSLPITQEYPKFYLSAAEQLSKPILFENYVVLHLEPNAKLNFRKVYGIDWKEIVNHLASKNLKTIIVGTENIEVENAITYKGNIRQLLQVIKNCKLFIGVDSGPSHIAASLQIPAIIFFGAVNPVFRHFKQIFNGTIMQQQCEFAGCYHEVISSSGQICKIVGNEGIPKCCVHTTESLIEKINNLYY